MFSKEEGKKQVPRLPSLTSWDHPTEETMGKQQACLHLFYVHLKKLQWGPSAGSNCLLLQLYMHVTWIQALSWSHDTHCAIHLKQRWAFPAADSRGLKRREKPWSPWSGLCLCWSPEVYSPFPFDPRIACQGGACLLHSLFSISESLLSSHLLSYDEIF